MSAGLDFASLCSSIGIEAISAILPQALNPISMSRLEGRPVVRSPQQLRLHPALEEIGWPGVIDEFNDAARLPNPSVPEPILIATNGAMLSGFGRWRLAVFEGWLEINCIEYPFSEDESLQFMLTHHQIRRGWNDFVRICLALKLKTSFRQKALDNMSAGGKHKGLANLPDLQRIDVRQDIANLAAVCPRNVGNVEMILEKAHPRLLDALRDGTLRINRAMQLCRFSQTEQLERFIRYTEESAINKVIRQSIPRPKPGKTILDVGSILGVLVHREAQQPGSVAVRVGRHKRTVILVGQELLAEVNSQKELPLK